MPQRDLAKLFVLMMIQWLEKRSGGGLFVLTLAITVLLIPVISPAQQTKPTEALKAAESPFEITLIDGKVIDGSIQAMNPDGVIRFKTASGEDRSIPITRVIKLTHKKVICNFPPTEGSFIMLPRDDRIVATIESADDATLKARSYVLGDLEIPLDLPLALVLKPPSEPAAVNDLIEQILKEKGGAERLWLANGDRQKGTFLGIDGKSQKLRFQQENAKLELDRAGIVALILDRDLIDAAAPSEPWLEISLVDGSRISLEKPRYESDQFLGRTRFARDLRIPVSEIARIHARHGKVRYLADEDHAAVRYTPYIGPPRPIARNAAVDRSTLRLADQSYDRGLGMSSRTLLAYRLQPDDERFQALIGVNDDAGPSASVVFRVLVDSREVYASPPRTARDEPIAVDVSVQGGKALILTIEFGDRGNVRDHADWVEARVVKP